MKTRIVIPEGWRKLRKRERIYTSDQVPADNRWLPVREAWPTIPKMRTTELIIRRKTGPLTLLKREPLKRHHRQGRPPVPRSPLYAKKKTVTL